MKRIIRIFALLSFITIISCDITNKTETPQSEIQIEVVRPIIWEEFSDENLIVDLLISSTQEIQNVKLYVDGDSVSTLNSAPYRTEIAIGESGTHNFYAVVTDQLLSQKNSAVINFALQTPDNETPSGFIASPADWTTISGNIDVIISAVDNENISAVKLFVDGQEYATIERALYQFNLDSTELANENHTLFAEIFDTSGNSATTQLITVRVLN
ncbi:MAG: Ig-like domain-containing protein [Candidatus Cloacimonadales bacterium]